MRFLVKGVHCPSCAVLVRDILQDAKVAVRSFTINEKKKEGILDVEDGTRVVDAIQAETTYTVVRL